MRCWCIWNCNTVNSKPFPPNPWGGWVLLISLINVLTCPQGFPNPRVVKRLLFKITPHQGPEGLEHQPQIFIAVGDGDACSTFLKTPDKPLGIKNILGIKLALNPGHQSQSITPIAPGIQFLFELGGTVPHHEIALVGLAKLTQTL